MTWCVQIKHLIPKAESIFYVCHDWRVFITMTLSAYVVMAVLYVIQVFDDIHPKWDWHRLMLLCWANMCGFPYTYRPRITASRIYYACCLYGAIVFIIVFAVQYQLFMTNLIYEQQVDSIDEIIKKDFALAGDSLALKQLYKQNEVHEQYHNNIEYY